MNIVETEQYKLPDDGDVELKTNSDFYLGHSLDLFVK